MLWMDPLNSGEMISIGVSSGLKFRKTAEIKQFEVQFEVHPTERSINYKVHFKKILYRVNNQSDERDRWKINVWSRDEWRQRFTEEPPSGHQFATTIWEKNQM